MFGFDFRQGQVLLARESILCESVMALPNSLNQIELTKAEVFEGLQLSDEAGWNQTPEDWEIYINHGRVIGLRTEEGKLVATAGVMPYPPQFGFLALVLVTQAWRHRGLATHLAGECLAMLRRANLTPMLNATPAGAAAYERLGFRPVVRSHRWEASLRIEDRAIPASVREAEPRDLEDLITQDAIAFGAERQFLLIKILARKGTIAFVPKDGRGFIIARLGRHATLLGPLVADTPSSGLHLLDAALSVIRGPTFIDVRDELVEFGSQIEAHGFRQQRPFLRMALGRMTPFGDTSRMFLGAGPEFG
jgi:GNAT superfamily N-acetyltransferase